MTIEPEEDQIWLPDGNIANARTIHKVHHGYVLYSQPMYCPCCNTLIRTESSSDRSDLLEEWYQWVEQEKAVLKIERPYGPEMPLDRPLLTEWQPIETSPINFRVMIECDNEIALGWCDRIDKRWYYAPQGGLIPWIPLRWCDIPRSGQNNEKV